MLLYFYIFINFQYFILKYIFPNQLLWDTVSKHVWIAFSWYLVIVTASNYFSVNGVGSFTISLHNWLWFSHRCRGLFSNYVLLQDVCKSCVLIVIFFFRGLLTHHFHYVGMAKFSCGPICMFLPAVLWANRYSAVTVYKETLLNTFQWK